MSRRFLISLRLTGSFTLTLLLLAGELRQAKAAGSAPTFSEVISLVPPEYRHSLVQQLSLAPENRDQWLGAISRAQPDHREAIAFLLVNMPEQDLHSLSAEFLLRNVELAYEARARAPWGAAVPKEIFFDDVLSYSNLNERRDDWRPDFYKRFWPLVKECKTASDAAQVLNREVFKILKVSYNAVKRPKPDQSPYESTGASYASCSGLSIILVDACRAVGVPARVAGTPLWTNGSGNHTWVEVWDKQWWFTGAAEPGEFNKTWFADLAARADGSKPGNRIYAASFRRTNLPFLMVWKPQSVEYSAVDVTDYYVHTKPAEAPPATQPAELLDDWAKMQPIVPRGYVCHRASTPIKIDGKAEEPAWAEAPWTADFVDIEGNRRPAPRFRTRAKMLWDDQNLYLFAELEEPHVWATIKKKNQVIFQDNDFEVFLSPTGDNHNYHEFEMNALNTIWELALEKPYRDGGPIHDPSNIEGLESAVHVNGTINDPSDTDHSWCVELSIPWKGLAQYAGRQPCPPKDGDQWRANFSRVEWLVDIIDGHYRKIPKEMRPEDNWIWSPQGVVDMHRPERWGYIQFSASPATSDFRPDPTLPARDTLMSVYYKQREFHARFGQYASSLAKLESGPQPASAAPITVDVTTTPGGYTATARVTGPHDSVRILHVREDSKIWEDPTAALGASTAPIDDLSTWIAKPSDERPALKDQPFARSPLTKADAERARQLLWDDHEASIRTTRDKEWKDRAITIGPNTLKWKQVHFGTKPKGGWNLYISLHGGGGAPTAVNDQQWENQIKLYRPKDSLYLAPRAPTDHWNLWHESHIDPLFDRLLEDAFVLGEVNPNRVYIMGYSAGGDGVYQLAPRMADRWAAAAMMAGHPNDASPLGLRDIGFTIHVGALDNGYNRNKVAAEWATRLDELQQADPQGYRHVVKLHEGRGHWMNLEDAVAVDWMAGFTRNPLPDKVVWQQSPVTHDRFYWLALPSDEAKGGQLIIASRNGQKIEVEKAGQIKSLTILLNDSMLDLDQPVTVGTATEQLFQGKAPRTIEHLYTTVAERGDPDLVFSAVVTVTLP